MLSLVLAASLAALAVDASGPESRQFRIEHVYAVPAPALSGKTATIFIPLPEDDPFQQITDLRIEGARFEVVHDARDGNAAARIDVPPQGLELKVGYTVTRQERSANLALATGRPAPASYARFLEGSRLVAVDARVQKIAAEVTRGAVTPLQKAQAIYAYVLSTMKYEKTGTGWGQGSIAWACDAKYGNCTDFHALTIGLLRASGIPARFQIGYAVPPGPGGELLGYHCWADFYLDGAGWVPLDASEGWKHPERRAYFFGHHDADRVALSTGRDLVFPGMKASVPLNYFVYPYAEQEGHALQGMTRSTRAAPLSAPQASPSAR
jgi:transglutaminase-like putative cysteine protease